MTAWKEIPGFEGLYEISSDGQVRSLARFRSDGWWMVSRILRPCINRGGYAMVSLFLFGKAHGRTVHRLVATAHLGSPPSPKSETRHLNGNRLDNRVENLSWGNAQENAADREAHGRTARGQSHGRYTKPERASCGSHHPGARLTEDQVVDIRRCWGNKESTYQLARRFSVSRRTIKGIIAGKSWRHVLAV